MALTRSHNLETVISLVSALSLEEREIVRSHLASLRSLQGSVSTAAVVSANGAPEVRQHAGVDDAIGELILFLNEAGVLEMPATPTTISSFKTSPRGRSSIPKFEGLDRFLDKFVKKRLEKKALLRIAYKMLFDKIQRRSTSVTLTQMANRVDEIPGVLDRAFPGYARAGLLSLAVHRNRVFEK